MWRSASGVKMTSTKDHSGLRAPRRDLMRLSTASAGTPLVGSARYSWWSGTTSSSSSTSLAMPAPPPSISGLNHTARSLAVYASQGEILTTTQDSLPVGWPAFPGGSWLAAGSQRKVSGHSILLSQASPGAL
jgi:hypothetical protein